MKTVLWDPGPDGDYSRYKGQGFEIIDQRGLRNEAELGAPGCNSPLEALKGLALTLQWFIDKNPYADTIVYRTLPEVSEHGGKYHGYCRLLACKEGK